jgi:hypothetical protein
MVCPTPLLESIPRPPAHLEHRPNPTPRTRRPLPAYPQFREGQQRRTLLCPTTTGPVEIRRSEPARQIATEEASDQDIPRILVGLHQAWLHLELLGQTGLSLLSDCFLVRPAVGGDGARGGRDKGSAAISSAKARNRKSLCRRVRLTRTRSRPFNASLIRTLPKET